MTSPWVRIGCAFAFVATLTAACTADDTVPTAVPETSAAAPQETATTTPQGTTVPAPVATMPPPPPAGLCDSYADPVAVGTVANAAVIEASGIATSRLHEGIIWMHNDSGGGAVVHATDVEGTDFGSFEVDAPAFDWEDMAIGPGPDGAVDYLYLGDIGDNLHFRPAVTIYRFVEPTPDPSGGSVSPVESFNLVYPEPGFDSETLLVDPVTGDILVVTKGAAGETSRIYRAVAGQLRDGATVQLEEIGTFNLEPGAYVTAGDISSTGSAILFRGYNEVWLWERVDLDLTETFAIAPCRTPSTAEVQGEAIAFSPDGFSYFTISEGQSPDINYVESLLAE